MDFRLQRVSVNLFAFDGIAKFFFLELGFAFCVKDIFLSFYAPAPGAYPIATENSFHGCICLNILTTHSPLPNVEISNVCSFASTPPVYLPRLVIMSSATSPSLVQRSDNIRKRNKIRRSNTDIPI
jgi:hypothetical protein